jgi:hypothetical protein
VLPESRVLDSYHGSTVKFASAYLPVVTVVTHVCILQSLTRTPIFQLEVRQRSLDRVGQTFFTAACVARSTPGDETVREIFTDRSNF